VGFSSVLKRFRGCGLWGGMGRGGLKGRMWGSCFQSLNFDGVLHRKKVRSFRRKKGDQGREGEGVVAMSMAWKWREAGCQARKGRRCR